MNRTRLPSVPIPFSGTREQAARDESVQRLRDQLGGNPVLRSKLVTGDVDEMAPSGRTDGIPFVASVTRTIDHGAGEAVVAFQEIAMVGQTRPALVDAHTSAIDTTKQIRVTPTNTGRAWVLVFFR